MRVSNLVVLALGFATAAWAQEATPGHTPSPQRLPDSCRSVINQIFKESGIQGLAAHNTDAFENPSNASSRNVGDYHGATQDYRGARRNPDFRAHAPHLTHASVYEVRNPEHWLDERRGDQGERAFCEARHEPYIHLAVGWNRSGQLVVHREGCHFEYIESTRASGYRTFNLNGSDAALVRGVTHWRHQLPADMQRESTAELEAGTSRDWVFDYGNALSGNGRNNCYLNEVREGLNLKTSGVIIDQGYQALNASSCPGIEHDYSVFDRRMFGATETTNVAVPTYSRHHRRVIRYHNEEVERQVAEAEPGADHNADLQSVYGHYSNLDNLCERYGADFKKSLDFEDAQRENVPEPGADVPRRGHGSMQGAH